MTRERAAELVRAHRDMRVAAYKVASEHVAQMLRAKSAKTAHADDVFTRHLTTP